MGSSNIYTAGLNNVGSYQVSGIPFATGSIDASGGQMITFPNVTRWVLVHYSASSDNMAPLKVGFSQVGIESNPHNFFLEMKPNTTSPRLELKLTQLMLFGGESGELGVSVMAGLTNLPVARVDNISPSGSNWSGSSGVG